VYQGEHATCDLNRALGRYLVNAIPLAAAGEEQVDVRFSYDINGILEVETTVVSTGKKRHRPVVVTAHPALQVRRVWLRSRRSGRDRDLFDHQRRSTCFG
jgi:hypothetical protein